VSSSIVIRQERTLTNMIFAIRKAISGFLFLALALSAFADPMT
jgi:hypothetical protein